MPDGTRAERTTWSRVDSGFHVGSRRGEFVGFVDTTPEQRHVAFDGRSQRVGEFVDVAQAKAAVEAVGAATSGLPALRPADGAGAVAARVTGGIAVLLAASAAAAAPYL